MNTALTPEQLDVVRAYSAGRLGTREAIGLAGFHDYADLLTALARNDLPFPEPADTPQRREAVARATEILQPLLRRPHSS